MKNEVVHSPIVGVILLNYNSYSDTINVVNELYRQVGVNFKIIIVDNNSSDESCEAISNFIQHHSSWDITLLQNDQNIGYARGNNIGLRFLKNFNIDYVAVLNSDIYFVNDKLFHNLVLRYSTLPNVGFIEPQQYNINNQAVWEWPYLPKYSDLIFSTSYIGRRWLKYLREKKLQKRAEDINYSVEIFGGSFIFTSFSFFDSIDFFDECTFLFGEERFWAYKIKESGKVCYILKDLKYIHNHSKTINKTVNLVRRYKLHHTSVLNYLKYSLRLPNFKICLLSYLYKYTIFEIRVGGSIKQLISKIFYKLK